MAKKLPILSGLKRSSSNSCFLGVRFLLQGCVFNTPLFFVEAKQ